MDSYPNADQRASALRQGGSFAGVSEDSESERSSPEVSVIIPCLNEADTLETCLKKARRALSENQITGEIIVADNGSTDGSQAIAERMGARVVEVETRGYGNALMGGIAAAHGTFVVMGDADDSYDFLEIPSFVEKLRAGFDLVQGCRLRSGGGIVLPGAMPLLHRWWGNPMFSSMTRWMFRAPVHDVYCGMRGFSKGFYERMNPRCTGMEFATEMVIKASLYGEKIAEVPITLHRDGRKSHAPHLKTFRDGWRTLCFFLMYSPRWLFLIPGMLLIVLGLIAYGIAMPGMAVMGVAFDAHTLLFASLAILCGYQSILFAIFTKTFAIAEGLLPEDRRMSQFFKVVSLERGLMIGSTTLFLGSALLLAAINQWRSVNFGNLDYAQTMRLVVPGVTLAALGFQTILSSFFAGILKMHRR
jgi:glycosyltransferase involved in cell wall biosynthesis